MNNIDIIDGMLCCHKKYRESYVTDLDSEDTRVRIFKLLLNRTFYEAEGTYSVEKEIIKLDKVLEIKKLYDDINYVHSDILDNIWQNSLFEVIEYKNTCLDLEQFIGINKIQYQELLKTGREADKNIEKIECLKLKIKLKNKKISEQGRV